MEENPLWGGLVFVDEQYVTGAEKKKKKRR